MVDSNHNKIVEISIVKTDKKVVHKLTNEVNIYHKNKLKVN